MASRVILEAKLQSKNVLGIPPSPKIGLLEWPIWILYPLFTQLLKNIYT